MPKVIQNDRDVFINCPFDTDYQPIFRAIVFAVIALDFNPRCAREEDDSGEIRLGKIERLIDECAFGIHDLSRVTLDKNSRLPRFNMPFELGLYMGAKRYGGKRHKNKKCLILEDKPYRYQKFLSDIAGQDIHNHDGNQRKAIIEVRDCLTSALEISDAPGGEFVADRFDLFTIELPQLCKNLKRNQNKLTFKDFRQTVIKWLDAAL